MDAEIKQLAAEISAQYQTLEQRPPHRLIVGIAGLPGCGKSTLCHPLTEQINAQFRGGHIARCVSLDGWHLPRSELDKFPNAAEAHYRRGAPFTFDVKGYTRFLHLLRNDFSSPIDFPVFEHSVKDPAPSGKPILPCERIVIIEGLYTLLSDGEWRPLSESLDYSIYMDIDRNIARERCIERNFKAGLTETIEKTTERVDQSDLVNGDLVAAKSITPSRIVRCV